jgi:hypothetical protein
MENVIVTCEHGGNRISPAYFQFFRRQQRLMDAHRGNDPGELLAASLRAARGE